jgi:hypothetical protein
MVCYFLSHENHDEVEMEFHLEESKELECLYIGPWHKLEVILVRMSIYMFCAELLGPIITGT